MNHRALNSTIEKDSETIAPIIEAIIEGKYSWACVLLLRTIGYNPLHYIPYRTYNRLIKENYLIGTQQPSKTEKGSQHSHAELARRSHDIRDLPYAESLDDRNQRLRGGSSILWLTSSAQKNRQRPEPSSRSSSLKMPSFLNSISRPSKP